MSTTPAGIPTFDATPDTGVPAAPSESALLTRRFPEYPNRYTFEPSSRWVRGVVGDTAIVDSRHQLLVWEPRHKVPEYGFPRAHVRTDLLVPGQPPTLPYYRPKSTDVTWYDLVLEGRRIPAAAWSWNVAGLEDYLGVTWYDGVLDAWYEEGERVHTHPRDPGNRADVVATPRHVVVRVGDRVLADSRDGYALFENGLPTRFYLPSDDVVWDELVPVDDLVTSCPYKGYTDGYWALRDDPTNEIAWRYTDPSWQVAPIRDRIAFYNERVDLVVDGAPFIDSRRTWA